MSRKTYVKLPPEMFKTMQKEGAMRVDFIRYRELAAEFNNFMRNIAAEVIEAEEEVVIKAVMTAAREAGVDTLYIFTKEFILSALKHEAERRKGAKQ